ncbi:hypothetical protein K2X05_12970 [bacterium]|nr:hypothetical protein [bacterium]
MATEILKTIGVCFFGIVIIGGMIILTGDIIFPRMSDVVRFTTDWTYYSIMAIIFVEILFMLYCKMSLSFAIGVSLAMFWTSYIIMGFITWFFKALPSGVSAFLLTKGMIFTFIFAHIFWISFFNENFRKQEVKK